LDSWSHLSEYYTPELEAAVEEKHADDYDIPKFHLEKRKVGFPKVGESNDLDHGAV
jgi:hypothetical protein